MNLDDAQDDLDVILLRRDKLALLVARLRAIHRKLTRTQRYRPVIRQGDTHMGDEWVPPREPHPWQASRKRDGRGRPVDENPKGLWRKAKAPW